MFTKFAKLDVLEVRSAPAKVHSASLTKFADFNDYRTDDGYVYIRVRAISSRVNKNHDGWPSEELAKSYRSFVGKPLFVDHHNSDPQRARGVVVDAQIHVEELDKISSFDPYYASAPENHKPPTWVELLLEVDAKRFPKLAKAVINGDIDGVSMGANVEWTQCSHCANKATTPEEYCQHVSSKGAYFDFIDKSGQKTSKRSYEDCFGVGFFELSFVFDPADETALINDIRTSKVAEIVSEGETDYAQAPGGLAAGGTDHAHLMHAAQAAFDRAFTHTGGQSGESQGFLAAKRSIEQAGYPQMAFSIANEIKQRHLGLLQQAAKTTGDDMDASWIEAPTGAFERGSMDNSIWSSVREADRRNPVPQGDMTVAPDKVDTMRQEQLCPICGSDMDDGVCQVCNYEEPPEGFDNPDLEKAQQVDQQMRQQDASQAVQNAAPGGPPPTTVDPTRAQPLPQAGPPGMPMSSSVTPNVWASHPVTGEKIAATKPTTTQERPILPVTRKLSDKPLNVQVKQDATAPKESSTRKETMTDQIKTADGATADGGSEVQPDRRVDVMGVGGVSGDPEASTQHENVEKAMSQEGGPHTDTWSKGEGDSLGQHEPVSGEERTQMDLGGPIGAPVSHVHTADGADNANDVGGPIGEGLDAGGRDKGGPTWDSGTSGWPDHDPTRVDLLAPLKEEIGEGTKTFPSDSFHIGDPVTSEGANDNLGGPIGTGINAPMKDHQPSGVPATSSVYAHAVKAMKLAETEVLIGYIEEGDKFNRVAALEGASIAEIDAAQGAYDRARSAMIKKASTLKTAGAHRMPSFSKRASVEPMIEVAGGWEPEDSLY